MPPCLCGSGLDLNDCCAPELRRDFIDIRALFSEQLLRHTYFESVKQGTKAPLLNVR